MKVNLFSTNRLLSRRPTFAPWVIMSLMDFILRGSSEKKAAFESVFMVQNRQFRVNKSSIICLK